MNLVVPFDKTWPFIRGCWLGDLLLQNMEGGKFCEGGGGGIVGRGKILRRGGGKLCEGEGVITFPRLRLLGIWSGLG